jgi:hypothetical protein
MVLLWADTAVTATFNLLPVTAQLTVNRAGGGTGIVTSAPAGINCGATCSADYAGGTVVTLTATPSGGSTFAGWTGGCTGTGTCVVTLNANTTLTATFNTVPPTVTFSLTMSGTGTGTVTCNGAACQPSYPSGTALTIVATPAVTSLFSGWGGDCTASGTAATCNLTLNANTTVSATFNLPTLSVVVAGTGSVTSSPAGISCGAICTASFSKGTSITLSATPVTGMTFSGWNSGGCAGAGTCTVTLTANTTITAMFGTVQSSERFLFFARANSGPLMAVNPASPASAPTTVADATASAGIYSGVWNPGTSTFTEVQRQYQVYTSAGKLWRVSAAIVNGAPGTAGNPAVQISNETSAVKVCNLTPEHLLSGSNIASIVYELGGADGKCGGISQDGGSDGDNLLKSVLFTDGALTAPTALGTGLTLGGDDRFVYDFMTGEATHVFLTDAANNNTLKILNLATNAIVSIQANIGNVWVVAQDTSDRIFLRTHPGDSNAHKLWVYTISSNKLELLFTAAPFLFTEEEGSDGTSLYFVDVQPGVLYKVPLTATSAAQVVRLASAGQSLTGVGHTTNRVYVSTATSVLSVPKTGGAFRVDVPAVAGRVVVPLFYSSNGLLYYSSGAVSGTSFTLTNALTVVLGEDGTTLQSWPNTLLAGSIFSPSVNQRGEYFALSKVYIADFINSSFAGGTVRALDAATALPTVILGTIPSTSPPINPFFAGLEFFYWDNAALGFGALGLTLNNSVFFADATIPNSLVRVPITADQWFIAP